MGNQPIKTAESERSLHFSHVDDYNIRHEFQITKLISQYNISTQNVIELIEENGRYAIVLEKIVGKTMVSALPKSWYKLKKNGSIAC